MSHDGCVTVRGQLTEDEEARFTDWFLRSVRDRPADFQVGAYTFIDSKTGIEIWTANGRDAVSTWRPVHAERFRPAFQRAIWDAIHDFRHRDGSPASKELVAAMSKAPLADDSAPAPELRTEPEVAKLRGIVAAVMERPGLVGTSVGALILAISGFIAHAFAG